MEPIAKSGLYYPNKIARIAILALEEVMGRNGLNAILNLASLPNLIDNLPPDNLERKFDFADFSAINGALEEMFGPRGGRGLAQRAGRATFNDGLKNFGALAGAGDLAFRILPPPIKLRIGLPAMAKIFSTTSDQHSTVWKPKPILSIPSTAARYVGDATPINPLVLLPPACCKPH